MSQKVLCPNLEMFSAYIDGELSAAETKQLTLHAQSCGNCADTLTSLEELSDAFRALPRVSLEADLAPGIEAILARNAKQQRVVQAWRFAPLTLAAAATVMLGIFIGTTLSTTPLPHSSSPPMAMFDPIPPGGICIDLSACYQRKPI